MRPAARDRVAKMGMGFSLVEVVLALVVIVIGIIGIMALFPVGEQAFRESRSRNYAQDAADQFLRFYSSKMKQNWALADSLPICRPGDDETAVNWADDDANGIFSDIEGMSLRFDDRDNDSKYDYYLSEDTGDLSRDDSGLFRVVQRTTAQVTDFEAVLRVWRSTQTYKTYDAVSGAWSAHKPVPPDTAVTLNVEVSWPAEAPYAGRQRLRTALDVVRPSSHSIDVVRGVSDWPQTPPYTIWGVENSSTTLNYYTGVDTGHEVHTEGTLSGITGTPDVEAFTVVPGGVVYLISNDATSVLYKILPNQLDLNGATPVNVTPVGDTGLGGGDEITCLQVVEGELYGLTDSTKKIYRIDVNTGTPTYVGSLNVSSSFTTGGLTQGADETIYLTLTKNHNSELWKFTSFPGGEVVKVCDIPGSDSVDTLTAHPDGSVYAADDNEWYRINPETGLTQTIATYSNDIEAMDFNYGLEGDSEELNVFRSAPTVGAINLNPNNSPDMEFALTKPDGTAITRDDLHSEGTAYSYSGPAISVWCRPKGNGNQNGLTVDGDPFPLRNGTNYSITSDDMRVRLFNDQISGDGRAMGHWWVEITADGSTVITTE